MPEVPCGLYYAFLSYMVTVIVVQEPALFGPPLPWAASGEALLPLLAA